MARFPKFTTLKKLPWVSLVLLLAAYSSLGWLLSAFHDPWFVWVITVIGVLLLAASLSSPWSRISNGLARLFKSDTRAFCVTVVAAFFSVAIITWLHVFVQALLVISAGILVRLDAQTAGLNNGQTFWLVAIISLTGLSLGAAAETVVSFNPWVACNVSYSLILREDPKLTSAIAPWSLKIKKDYASNAVALLTIDVAMWLKLS